MAPNVPCCYLNVPRVRWCFLSRAWPAHTVVPVVSARPLSRGSLCLQYRAIFVTPRGLRGGLPRRYAPRNDARSARNDHIKAVAVHVCNTAWCFAKPYGLQGGLPRRYASRNDGVLSLTHCAERFPLFLYVVAGRAYLKISNSALHL